MMDPDQMLVTLGGGALIAAVLLFFFGPRGRGQRRASDGSGADPAGRPGHEV
jgi:hypothetical protein